jgi:hypothetical protein
MEGVFMQSVKFGRGRRGAEEEEGKNLFLFSLFLLFPSSKKVEEKC